jgi:hypothetical protein
MRNALLFACVLSLPGLAYAQDPRPVGVPAVWAPNPEDAALASQMTITLRAAVSTVPGWTIGTLATPLSELMRDCNGEVEGASGQCMSHMAAAHDPSIAHGLVLFAAIMRNDEGGLLLNLSLHTVADGASVGSLAVPIERNTLVGERNRLAADWLHQLAVQAVAVSPSATPVVTEPVPVDAHEAPPEPVVAPAPVVPEPVVPSRPVSSGDGFDPEYVAWPLIGLAGASLVMEIVSWVMIGNIQSDPDFSAFRASYGAGTGNVCSQAPTGSAVDNRGHALCGDAGTWESVEIAFGVIGGAALAGGLTALILDLASGHPSDEHALRLTPMVTAQSVALSLNLAF